MNSFEKIKYINTRTVWNSQERKLYFVISDVLKAFTKNQYPKDYTKKLRRYYPELAQDWNNFVVQLEVDTNGGLQNMNCTTALGMIRIIKSIRSPKSKLFRKWIESLDINPLDLSQKIKIPHNSIKEFYQVLDNLVQWKIKRKAFNVLQKEDPIFRKLNKLEIIFLLYEESDVFIKRKKPKKKPKKVPKKKTKKEKIKLVPNTKHPVETISDEIKT